MEYLLENIIVENDNENWISSIEISNQNVGRIKSSCQNILVFF